MKNKTELKTLKDIEKDFTYNNEEDFINSKKLKAEAVKWVKQFDDMWEQEEKVIYFIKYFFNLKEEDLK